MKFDSLWAVTVRLLAKNKQVNAMKLGLSFILSDLGLTKVTAIYEFFVITPLILIT
jgi:hypothetical protein